MMQPLCMTGVISFVPTVFTESGLLDEDRNRENFRRLIDAGMHGIQALGSAAEYFSVTIHEHGTMCRLLAEEIQRAERRVITVVGCGAQGLHEAIARAKLAKDHNIDVAMFVLPHYFPLSPDGAVTYFQKIAQALPGLALMHYNSRMAKTVLDGRAYAAMKHIDALIATKQVNLGGPGWCDLHEHAGHLNHVDCDDSFMFSFMNGATAVDLLISAMRPKLALALYEACTAKDWPRALELQQDVWNIMSDVNYGFIERHGYSDCAGDKALVQAAGFLHGGDPRPPYVGLSAEHKAELAQRMAKHPDLE